MPRFSGSSVVEGVLIDWSLDQPVEVPSLPVGWLSREQVAGELQRRQRRQAMDAAYEAELILRLAESPLNPGRFRQFAMDPDGTLHVTTPSGITRTTRPPGMRKPPPEPPPKSPPPPEPDDDPPPF